MTKSEGASRRARGSQVWVASNCETTQNDRAGFVARLMRHMPVDSLGSCLNTRPLPPRAAGARAAGRAFWLDKVALLAAYPLTLAPPPPSLLLPLQVSLPYIPELPPPLTLVRTRAPPPP